MQTIKNNRISISVKDKGAELTSIKTLGSNIEYMWQADQNYWGKYSPILFPVIGFMKDNEYIYNEKTYKMSKHGFARDMIFDLVEKTDKSLEYILKSNEQTLEMYPFEFELYVKYIIEHNTVKVLYKVINNEDKEMYFSIGAHPAFNCNINKGDKYIEFEKNETLKTHLINLDNGLIKNDKKDILDNNNKLMLNYNLFNEDALVFDGLKSKSIIIRDNNVDKVKVCFNGFPYLALWSPPAPFICIEPWYGVADFVNTNKRLEEKVGIQKLEAYKAFECSYEIEVNSL